MVFASLLLTTSLAVAPLEVRILERFNPVKVSLQATRFTCDGAAIPGTSLDAEVSVRTVRAGTADCTQLVAVGPVGVTIGSESRKYQGDVKLTLEGAQLRLVNVVDVEPYVAGVVAANASEGPAAVQEAAAIVARTFAHASRARHQRDGYHLCDEVHCQRYAGDRALATATTATTKSQGQVLLIGGIVLRPAHHHPSCGGHTSSSRDVWGEDGAGSAVSDPEKGMATWKIDLEKADLAQMLGRPATGTALEVLRRDRAGRIVELRSFGTRIEAGQLQSRLQDIRGPEAMPSLKFTITESDTSLFLEGTGEGHGVGLCLRGGRALAEQGKDAKAILLRYFPESQVKPAP